MGILPHMSLEWLVRRAFASIFGSAAVVAGPGLLTAIDIMSVRTHQIG